MQFDPSQSGQPDQSAQPDQQYPQWQQQTQQSLPNQQPLGQQLPNNGWQQPANFGQFQPLQPQPKKKRKRLWILGIVGGILLFSCAICGVIGGGLSQASNTGSATAAQVATPVGQAIQPTSVPTDTPTPVPTDTPTPVPTPTETPAQIEADYKASTTNTTVINLDKDGSADAGKDVHFTCQILNFVKDSTGNTAGANVDTQDSYSSSVIQVAFTPGTDLTQLNQGDILEVWGTDQGVSSGTNAYGGTVQEVGITAEYMNDQTTNYQSEIQGNKMQLLKVA